MHVRRQFRRLRKMSGRAGALAACGAEVAGANSIAVWSAFDRTMTEVFPDAHGVDATTPTQGEGSIAP